MQHRGDVAFFFVYVREAHPIDGQLPGADGMVEDPITDAERLAVAGTCRDELDLPMPTLVDRVDDAVCKAYGGWPDRLYVIGRDGRVVFAGDEGPFGFDVAAWRAAIAAAKAAAPGPRPPSQGAWRDAPKFDGWRDAR